MAAVQTFLLETSKAVVQSFDLTKPWNTSGGRPPKVRGSYIITLRNFPFIFRRMSCGSICIVGPDDSREVLFGGEFALGCCPTVDRKAEEGVSPRRRFSTFCEAFAVSFRAYVLASFTQQEKGVLGVTVYVTYVGMQADRRRVSLPLLWKFVSLRQIRRPRRDFFLGVVFWGKGDPVPSANRRTVLGTISAQIVLQTRAVLLEVRIVEQKDRAVGEGKQSGHWPSKMCVYFL